MLWLFKFYVHSKLNSPYGKPSKCPCTAEWNNKLWYFHTMEHFATVKINTPRLHATMDQMLSERSRSQSHTHCVISFIRDSKISKTNVWCSASRRGAPRGGEGGAARRKRKGAPWFFLAAGVGYRGVFRSWNSLSCSPWWPVHLFFLIGRLLYFSKNAKNYNYSKHKMIHSKIDFEKWLWGLWYLFSVWLFWNIETKHVMGGKNLLG